MADPYVNMGASTDPVVLLGGGADALDRILEDAAARVELALAGRIVTVVPYASAEEADAAVRAKLAK